MKIGTWNVNSIKARHDRLLAVLERHQPDVLCLQELKVPAERYPGEALKHAGYHSVFEGQKTYNGVAILSRNESSTQRIGMGDGVDDPQARIVAAEIDGVHVVSIYVPNGSTPDDQKFAYKLAWLERLMAYLDRHYSPEQPLAVCGDLNIAPDGRDVNRPEQWGNSVLCVPAAREAFERLIGWGLVDTFRQHEQEAGFYSWWDYRMLGFPKNNGLRIDHVLATPPLADRCTGVSIDRDERKGKGPSDHVPVIASFSDP